MGSVQEFLISAHQSCTIEKHVSEIPEIIGLQDSNVVGCSVKGGVGGTPPGGGLTELIWYQGD